MANAGAKSLFARCNENIVWLAAKQAPEAAEWKAYTNEVIALGRAQPEGDRLVRILVVTDGGGPSSVQRTDFVEAMGDIKVRTAVLSSNMLVRGIVTVFNWFNVQNKIFAPREVIAALEFVGIGATGRASIWSTVESLASQLGGVDTVAAARVYLKKEERPSASAR
jgi:hypothetical protein